MVAPPPVVVVVAVRDGARMLNPFACVVCGVGRVRDSDFSVAARCERAERFGVCVRNAGSVGMPRDDACGIGSRHDAATL